ncbi:MAG TPA: glutamate racemase [Syntrophomonadaceae bacterium]|nr:glutamate racemase [Syntrophomonadaceae bacterium]
MGKNNPIGIFDSGVGGLTVVKSLIERLPQEKFIYFGDTINVPYGNKTEDQLFSYAYSIIDFLIESDAKALIVACGTHSSITLPKLSQEYVLPMLGVVKPGADAAVKASKTGKIGVLATSATVNSLAFTKAIKSLNSECEVLETACPKFVPLVEAGNLEGADTKSAIEEYIEPLLNKGIDTLILGCTHYPFLSKAIKDYIGEEVILVDPSFATIEELKKLLIESNLLNDNEQKAKREFYVSGNDESFYNVGNLLLGNMIEKVSKVNLD